MKLKYLNNFAFSLVGVVAAQLLFTPLASHTQMEAGMFGMMLAVAVLIFAGYINFGSQPMPDAPKSGLPPSEGTGTPAKPVNPPQAVNR